jgi:hypothetical protein
VCAEAQTRVLQPILAFVVQSLPALIALMAWGEAGHRLFKQFGARMMWELAGLAVVAVAFLLYATLQFDADDGTNFTAIAAASLCAVLTVTAMVHKLPNIPSRWRPAVSLGVSLVALPLGALLGAFVRSLASAPRP